MDLKNKKVLMMGLGILGGGAATAKWLIKQGTILTVTDIKEREKLLFSLERLEKFEDKIEYKLGGHKEEDFLNSDIIVVNPDVSINNKFVKLAKEAGKQIENELTLFYKFCPSKNIIAVTGTRGKTTTTNWVHHFLKAQYPNAVLAGNSSTNPFLGMIDKCKADTSVAVEVPSYHLELLKDENQKFKPKVAVITNVFQDHLNRHGSLENYAKIKANIFKHQTKEDFLILNKNNKWTDYFISLKPKSKILYFSEERDSGFAEKWGEHNVLNLTAATLAVQAMGVGNKTIEIATETLPQIKFRQEKIYEKNGLEIVNDSAATSPEATIIAVERFRNNDNLILITGGTDRELDFKEWGKMISKNIKPENLILLSGSATEKMKIALKSGHYNECDTLEECLRLAIKKSEEVKGKSIILFSPSSKSFEKFKNEYDRGEQFNNLVKKLLK